MMRTAIGLVILTTATATTARADDVLVWADATFATDAKPGVDTVRLSSAKRTLGEAIAMHAVGPASNGLVEVEVAVEPGCARYVLYAPSYITALHLFVREADLVPVVARDWTDKWKDGGWISLSAGIPYDRATHTVPLADLAVPVDVPANLIGTRFVRGQPKPDAADGDSTTSFAIAGKPLPFGAHRVTGSLSSTAVRKLAHDKIAFPYTERCISGEVVVDAKAVTATPLGLEGGEVGGEVGGVAGGVAGGGGGGWTLPKGTPLTTPSGTRVIAKLAYDLDVSRPTNDKTASCMRIALNLEGDGDATTKHSLTAPLSLCAAPGLARPPRR